MTVDQKKYNKEYYSRPDIKSAHSDYMKQYYQKHRIKILEKQSKYYLNNKEKIKNYMKTYMRTYKKSDVIKLRKDMIDPKSKIIDILDTDKVGSITDDDSSK